jgi:hypothetical protein
VAIAACVVIRRSRDEFIPEIDTCSYSVVTIAVDVIVRIDVDWPQHPDRADALDEMFVAGVAALML